MTKCTSISQNSPHIRGIKGMRPENTPQGHCLQETEMTFPHDQMRDEFKAEEHSIVSIALVSTVMIFAALGGLIAAV